MPSFVSGMAGRPLRAQEIRHSEDLTEITYRDTAGQMGAELRAERVLEDPMWDLWVVRLRWMNDLGPQELRFVSVGDLTIYPEDDRTIKRSHHKITTQNMIPRFSKRRKRQPTILRGKG